MSYLHGFPLYYPFHFDIQGLCVEGERDKERKGQGSGILKQLKSKPVIIFSFSIKRQGTFIDISSVMFSASMGKERTWLLAFPKCSKTLPLHLFQSNVMRLFLNFLVNYC